MKDRISDTLSIISVVALLVVLFIQRADIHNIKEDLAIVSDISAQMYVCLGMTENRVEYFTCIDGLVDNNEIDDSI